LADSPAAICNACQFSGNPLGARFCANCGQSLEGSSGGVSAAVGDDIRLVTMIFADLRGFTRLSERLEPEAIREILNGCFEGLAGCVRRFGGTVDKYIGDCLMALFGAPTSHGNDPERAVRAAIAMQVFMEEYSQAILASYGHHLAIRVGISTGKVFAGWVGDEQLRSYTVIGDPVNTAERIESAAPSGGILLSESTYRHVRGIFDAEALDPLVLKGKSEPVPVYRVRGDGQRRSVRIGVRTLYGVEVNMIGRQEELDALVQQWGLVRSNGSFGAVTAIGPEGIGKSRLIHELLKHFASEGEAQQFLIGNCTPHGQSPLEAFAHMVLGLARIPRRASMTMARARMRQICRAAVPDMKRADKIADDLLLMTGFLPARDGDWRATRQNLFAALRDLLRGMASETPLFIVLEDLHWSSSLSRDLIVYLAAELAELPVLMLCLARPSFLEEEADWQERLQQHRLLELQPLSEGACEQLVGHLLRRLQGDKRALIEEVAQRSDGNPFYVEEIIRDLVDRGVVRIAEPTHWMLIGDADTIEVPSTVEGVLQARLDRLSPGAREVLHRAAVVGRTFWRGSLLALGCEDRLLDESIDELQQRELVFRRGESLIHGDTEYIFKQTLVRDVAYENLLRSQRILHHKSVAQWLAKHRHGRGDDFMLGHHFERGDQPEKAVLAYMRAAHAALDSNALEEALSVHSRALAITERHPEVEVTPGWSTTSLPADAVVLLGRARSHHEHGDFEAALNDLERVESSLQRSGRVAGLARCLALRGEVLLAAGGDNLLSEEVGDLAICARDLARAAGDLRAEFASRLLAGRHHLARGQRNAAAAELDALLGLADGGIASAGERLELSGYHAESLMAMGDFGGAEWVLREGLNNTPAEAGSSRQIARLLSQLAKVMNHRGEYRDAEYLEQRALSQLTASA
jgi:class 3 adenylate cyclase/tetratricopeptide (TPR) repeat protein